MAPRFIAILMFFVQNYAFGQYTSEDSLKSLLSTATTDTGRVSILIDLAYLSKPASQQRSYAYQAYQEGRKLDIGKHRIRSKITYGSFLADVNLDSGKIFLKEGVEDYRRMDLPDYEANALYLLALAFEFNNQLDSAICYYKKTYDISLQAKAHPEWGDAAYNISYLYNNNGNNIEALAWAEKALDAYQNQRNAAAIADAHNQIGIIFLDQGIYAKALEKFYLARDIAAVNKETEIELTAINNIALIYEEVSEPSKAINAYNEAYEKARMLGFKGLESTLLNNLGYQYASQGDTIMGISFLRKAIALEKEIDDPCSMSFTFHSLGEMYLSQDKLDSANKYLQKSLSVAEKCNTTLMLATAHKELGNLYNKKGNAKAAETSYKKSLSIAESAKLPVEKREALHALFNHFKTQNNTTAALTYLEKYYLLDDSLRNVSNNNEASRLIAQYKFKDDLSQFEQERKQSEEVLEATIAQKAFENKLIIIIAFLLAAILAIIIRAYYLIKKNATRLELLNQEKNELMGIVAHDLRSPLHNIIGLLNLLKGEIEHSKNDEVEDYLNLLDISTSRMNHMITKVLDLSAVEDMKINIDLRKTDLCDVVDRAQKNYKLLAQNKNIALEKICDKNCYSKVDPDYLEQVLDNLLSNAIKFSEPGKKVQLKLMANGTKNIIAVADQGPGIQNGDHKKLFKAFKPLTAKPTMQETSTGLGLSIAHKFTEAMHGSIQVQSEPGQGTEFRVLFDKV